MYLPFCLTSFIYLFIYLFSPPHFPLSTPNIMSPYAILCHDDVGYRLSSTIFNKSRSALALTSRHFWCAVSSIPTLPRTKHITRYKIDKTNYTLYNRKNNEKNKQESKHRPTPTNPKILTIQMKKNSHRAESFSTQKDSILKKLFRWSYAHVSCYKLIYYIIIICFHFPMTGKKTQEKRLFQNMINISFMYMM